MRAQLRHAAGAGMLSLRCQELAILPISHYAATSRCHTDDGYTIAQYYCYGAMSRYIRMGQGVR